MANHIEISQKYLLTESCKWHKKASFADLIKKTWHGVLKIDACVGVKHKIISSWPKAC